MLKVFKMFDSEGEGHIDAEAVHQALVRRGKNLDLAEVEDMLEELKMSER